MSQLESLTRGLLAAGGATPIDGEGTYLLYVENSALIAKHWTGKSFGNQELVANSALNGSTTAYLITSTTKRIVYISSSFLLRSRIYDEEEEEWVDDSSIGSHKVHPQGNVAGSVVEGTEKQQNILFQDPSRKLVLLDSSWKPMILPVNAAEGSPLAVHTDDVATYIFYFSADDNCLHYANREQGSTGWGDAVFSAYAFKGEEKPKRFLISQNDNEDFEAYILTESMKLRQLREGEEKTSSMGTVNAAGEWVPSTKEECCMVINWAGCFRNSHRRPRMHPKRRHRRRC